MGKWDLKFVDIISAINKQIDDDDRIRLIAHIMNADHDDDFKYDEYDENEYLYTEERLYEALGKEDARTILSEHENYQMAQVIVAALTGRKIVVKDEREAEHLAWRTQEYIRCVKDLEYEETKKKKNKK